MNFSKRYLSESCQLLSVELTRLEQLGLPFSLDEFYSWSITGEFIENLFKQYGVHIQGLHELNPSNDYCNRELIEYINHSFEMMSHIVNKEMFAINDSAYLLSIHYLILIMTSEFN
ncbi:hypothetical protein MASR2M36_03720 [Providencia sp.]